MRFWRIVKFNKKLDKDKIDPLLLASAQHESESSVMDALQRVAANAKKDDAQREEIFETIQAEMSKR